MAKSKEEAISGELVQTSTQALAGQEAAPSFVKVGDRTGTEHLTTQDIQLPRLSIAQQMSPELVQVDPKYIEGLQQGSLFNNLSQQVYGNGPLHFSIIQALPPRYVEFIPRELGGGVKDPNVPHDDPRTQFGSNGEKPIATKFYDFVIMLLPSRELIALSFKSTGIKTAKQLNGFISMRNAPLFAGKYSVETTMVTNPKGRFGVYIVKNAGWLPDQDTYNYAEKMFDNLRGKTIVITPEDDSFDTAALENEGSGDVGGH